MTRIEWYYAKQGKQFGPVSTLEVKQLADEGKLSREDLVWRDGMKGWVAARKVGGLFPEMPRGWSTDPAGCAPAAGPAVYRVPVVARTGIVDIAVAVHLPSPDESGADVTGLAEAVDIEKTCKLVGLELRTEGIRRAGHLKAFGTHDPVFDDDCAVGGMGVFRQQRRKER